MHMATEDELAQVFPALLQTGSLLQEHWTLPAEPEQTWCVGQSAGVSHCPFV